MTQTQVVKSVIDNIPINTLFVASDLYKKMPQVVSEGNYYKILERLLRENDIMKLSKGIYYVPKKNEFGSIPLSEDQLINKMFENKLFIEIGYKLYNKLGLTTQISKTRSYYVNVLTSNHRKIGNVYLYQRNFKRSDLSNKCLIEFLEVLQNFNQIQDINHNAFLNYARKITLDYKDDTLNSILKTFRFKKSTLAFLKQILDRFEINNHVETHLSSLSKYKIPEWGNTYDFAS